MYATKFALSGKWNRFAVKYLLRKCEMSACADVGKFHFTSSKARYFTMCGSTWFHVLRKQNISLYAFVSSNAVLVKKKGRRIFTIPRPFPVGRCYSVWYCSMAATHWVPFPCFERDIQILRIRRFFAEPSMSKLPTAFGSNANPGLALQGSARIWLSLRHAKKAPCWVPFACLKRDKKRCPCFDILF